MPPGNHSTLSLPGGTSGGHATQEQIGFSRFGNRQLSHSGYRTVAYGLLRICRFQIESEIRCRMSEFDELRRQLRIAYGEVIEKARSSRWPTQVEFATAVGLKLNTYRRIERGERPVNAPELDVIERVLGVEPGTLRAEAFAMIERGEIPSHAQRAADTWRKALNPKQHPS